MAVQCAPAHVSARCHAPSRARELCGRSLDDLLALTEPELAAFAPFWRLVLEGWVAGHIEIADHPYYGGSDLVVGDGVTGYVYAVRRPPRPRPSHAKELLERYRLFRDRMRRVNSSYHPCSG